MEQSWRNRSIEVVDCNGEIFFFLRSNGEICVTWFYIFSAILQINFSLFLLFQCCVCSVVSVSHHPYKKVSGTFLLLKSYSENTQNIVLLSPPGRIAPVHLSISPVLPSIWIRRLQFGHRCLVAVIGWPSKWLAKISMTLWMIGTSTLIQARLPVHRSLKTAAIIHNAVRPAPRLTLPRLPQAHITRLLESSVRATYIFFVFVFKMEASCIS